MDAQGACGGRTIVVVFGQGVADRLGIEQGVGLSYIGSPRRGVETPLRSSSGR